MRQLCFSLLLALSIFQPISGHGTSQDATGVEATESEVHYWRDENGDVWIVAHDQWDHENNRPLPEAELEPYEAAKQSVESNNWIANNVLEDPLNALKRQELKDSLEELGDDYEALNDEMEAQGADEDSIAMVQQSLADEVDTGDFDTDVAPDSDIDSESELIDVEGGEGLNNGVQVALKASATALSRNNFKTKTTVKLEIDDVEDIADEDIEEARLQNAEALERAKQRRLRALSENQDLAPKETIAQAPTPTLTVNQQLHSQVKLKAPKKESDFFKTQKKTAAPKAQYRKPKTIRMTPLSRIAAANTASSAQNRGTVQSRYSQPKSQRIKERAKINRAPGIRKAEAGNLRPIKVEPLNRFQDFFFRKEASIQVGDRLYQIPLLWKWSLPLFIVAFFIVIGSTLLRQRFRHSVSNGSAAGYRDPEPPTLNPMKAAAAPTTAVARPGFRRQSGSAPPMEIIGKDFRPTLEPLRRYVLFSSQANTWVLTKTDSDGLLTRPQGEVQKGTIVLGNLLGSANTLQRYKLMSDGVWRPTNEDEQFIVRFYNAFRN